jgi:creatinine amidohydrolase/Fe(II)-dependent formamide hydrolase-like protein
MMAEVHHPCPPSRYLPHLTGPEIAKLPKDKAAVVLSVASVEQHGPHLPCITDSLVGQTLLGLALERLRPDVQVWIVPPLCYGKSSVLGHPRTATAEKGNASVEATIGKLAGVLEEIASFEMPASAGEAG